MILILFLLIKMFDYNKIYSCSIQKMPDVFQTFECNHLFRDIQILRLSNKINQCSIVEIFVLNIDDVLKSFNIHDVDKHSIEYHTIVVDDASIDCIEYSTMTSLLFKHDTKETIEYQEWFSRTSFDHHIGSFEDRFRLCKILHHPKSIYEDDLQYERIDEDLSEYGFYRLSNRVFDMLIR